MKTYSKQYDAIFTTDFATIGIQLDGSSLTKVEYLNRRKTKRPATKLAEDIQKKIENYLDPKSNSRAIKVDVKLDVTVFQKKVLKQLMQIPYGETRTYGEIANKLKTSPRAVGNACRNNPVSIIIPCHRVVAANSIGGYGGATDGPVLDRKIQLLRLEGAI